MQMEVTDRKHQEKVATQCVKQNEKKLVEKLWKLRKLRDKAQATILMFLIFVLFK
jgi:hypothetical protein